MSVTQIAAKAGVSIATVSRVLNNSRPVKPEIAEAVRRAARELQIPLRPPRRRKPRGAEPQTTIAIVSLGNAYRGWFAVPVIASVVSELSRAAQNDNLGVLMAEMPDPRELGPTLRRPEVAGALALIDSTLSTEDIAVLSDRMPVVRVMGGQLAPTDIDHIAADNNSVGYLAARYLLDQGFSKIAVYSAHLSWDFIRLRVQSFLAWADRAGAFPLVLVDSTDRARVNMLPSQTVAEPDPAALITRLKEFAAGEPVGLFVTRDEETVLVYRLLREAGLEPGRDVLIVSCDNEFVRLQSLHPRPASIDLCTNEIASRAVQRLTARIQNRDEAPVRVLVNPKLIRPQDVAATPATDPPVAES